jgi:hypothetical protein
MIFTLKCMYEKGVLLDPAQMLCTPTYIGNFILENTCKLTPGCSIRIGHLFDSKVSTSPRHLVPPLYLAEITAIDDNQIIVRGWQVDLVDDSLEETRYRQCWLLRML